MKSIEERFWAKVNKTKGCWIWTGTLSGPGAPLGFGYGQFQVGTGIRVKAHRYSYEMKYGPIPKGLCACHKCDNPKCVNPDHIFIGTHRDNMIDAGKKGLMSRFKIRTHCDHGHLMDRAGTYIYQGHRRCRTCRAEASHRKRAKGKP